jgi:hypothetical protein
VTIVYIKGIIEYPYTMSDIQAAVTELEKSYVAKEKEISSAKDEEEVAATRRIRLEREAFEILKNLINRRTDLYMAVIKQQETAIADLKATVAQQVESLKQVSPPVPSS